MSVEEVCSEGCMILLAFQREKSSVPSTMTSRLPAILMHPFHKTLLSSEAWGLTRFPSPVGDFVFYVLLISMSSKQQVFIRLPRAA